MNQIQRYCRLQINFAFQTKPEQTKKGIERKNTQIKDKGNNVRFTLQMHSRCR